MARRKQKTKPRRGAPKVTPGASVRLRVTHQGKRIPGTWIVLKVDGKTVDVVHPVARDMLRVPRSAIELVARNPSVEEARMAQAYEDFHWGIPSKKKQKVKVAPRPETLMQLGELHAVTYDTAKGSYPGGPKPRGKTKRDLFEHEFGEEGGKKPILACDADGNLHIIGGDYSVKPEGITG